MLDQVDALMGQLLNHEIISGHVPGSLNIPFEHVLTNGLFKSKDELVDMFSKLINENKPVTFSCGSGLTACITLLAYDLVSDNIKTVYDGSWTEWASTPGMPIEHLSNT